MWNRDGIHIMCAGTFLIVEELEPLLHWSSRTRTNIKQAADNENRVRDWAISPTSLEPEREDPSHAVTDAVISEKQSAYFEHGSVAPPTTEEILVLDAVTRIQLHIEYNMAKLVHQTVMYRHKRVDNWQSASLGSLAKRILTRVASSTETVGRIM